MTGRQGRPSSVQPATAYDVRRYMTLVQVLATADREQRVRGICALAEEWLGMPPSDVMYVSLDSLINSLAVHVIKYHREEKS